MVSVSLNTLGAFVFCTANCAAGEELRRLQRLQGEEAAVEMARKRVVGAWVIVMRVFPAAILRDAGGGGTNANSRTKRSMNFFDFGHPNCLTVPRLGLSISHVGQEGFRD